MYSNKEKIESIYNVPNYLKEDTLLPIYFLYGEDDFTITQTIKNISKVIDPLITVDFDRESVNIGKESTIAQVIDLASSFPFGEGKKFIIAKGFENCGDKKGFAPYVQNPADFTILVIAQNTKKVNIKNEPYKSLYKSGYLFEASELKGVALQQWLIKQAKEDGLELSNESAQILIEMVGQNKALLEMQLRKFKDYLNEDQKLTPDVIESLASKTKEYTIFNLQDALGKGDKAKSLEIGYNLLDGSFDLIFIIAMLTKFCTTLTQIIELRNKKLPDKEAARETNTSFYYYINCKKASYLLNEKRLMKASKALLEADIRLKTTSVDDKNNFTILLSDILN
ncbi:MAG: DNA polymerase III subunit delta [Bacteroidota bacterium]